MTIFVKPCAFRHVSLFNTSNHRSNLIVQSSKGFGSDTSKSKKNGSEDEGVGKNSGGRESKRAGRNKGKQQMRVGQAAAQAAAQQQQRLAAMGVGSSSGQPAESITDQLEFEARLKALKAESEIKKSQISSQSGSILDTPSYDNPPPLGETLFGGKASDTNPAAEKEYSGASFGPSQVGLGIASLALVGVFLVANGGSELGYATKRPAQQTQQQQVQELGPEQRKDIEKQLEEINTKLKANGDDLESLEASAILHARLGEFGVAAEQLEKLTNAKPDDAEAWRVLAETRAAQGEAGKSVQAYEKALDVRQAKDHLQLLTGLADQLIADGKPQVAIEEIKKAKNKNYNDISDIELGLLLAKTYSQWRGHAPDAATQYDQLIQMYPQDFRPPLGKALLLRMQGQEGDAQRYILQAKYLAPPASRPIVDALTSS